MECPFCKIIEKPEKSFIIYESNYVIAFLDIDPINEGHILVVPKVHFSSIEEIPLHTLTEIMDTLQKIVVALKKVYNSNGYSIMQNGGEFCDFGHAHFHIFPRYRNDGFGWNYPKGTFESSEKVAEIIKTALHE